MQCPSCGSSRCRKALAVYEGGTRTSTGRSRGSGIGFGMSSRGRVGVGVGFWGSRRTGRSSSLAAQRAAPPWASGLSGEQILGLFVFLCFIFGYNGFEEVVGLAFWWTLGIVIGYCVIVGIWSVVPGHEYENRWYCGTCGTLFQA